MKFLPNSIQIFASTEDSYLRFRNADFFTPTTISWGNNNRTTALRIPESSSAHRRIEHRVPCNDADLEQVLYSILLAAGYGIKNKITPTTPKIFGNSFEPQYNLPKIPQSLREAQKFTSIENLINCKTFLLI